MLAQIKNAQAVKKERVKVVYTNLDFAVAELLAKHNFVESAAKKGRMPKRVIEIKLRYQDGHGVINGVRIVSKPSRRVYVGYQDLKPVRQGFGLGVISTPKGILTTMEARKGKVGGQLLFEIW